MQTSPFALASRIAANRRWWSRAIVDPAFPSGEVGQHLKARGEDAHIRRLAQLLLQPRPLRLAQHGRIRAPDCARKGPARARQPSAVRSARRHRSCRQDRACGSACGSSAGPAGSPARAAPPGRTCLRCRCHRACGARCRRSRPRNRRTAGGFHPSSDSRRRRRPRHSHDRPRSRRSACSRAVSGSRAWPPACAYLSAITFGSRVSA